MKILLATDGSEFSIEAVKKLGRILSGKEKIQIRIICVTDITAPPMTPFGKEKYLAEEKASQKIAEEAVNEARSILSKELGNKSAIIETDTIKGDAKKIILKEAEDWKAELIVVGSHGHGFLNRILLGSVSDAVVKYAGCSVLVVRK